MRGDRRNEVNSGFTCSGGSVVCFRARTSILGDIVDSSPTWVGPPQSPYTATWKDKLFPAASAVENTGTQNYLQYVTAEQTRPNIVYVGSNDGMMHGFRSGGFDSSGNFTTATTPNDGQEVIAYMPGSSLLSPSTGGACASLAGTGSTVQNIHGVTPAVHAARRPTQPACMTPALDFSGTQYGHNFFMNATPGTGDLFYNGSWHTWLAGGMGAGGAALFTLDVTDPTTFNEGNAASLVVGEWTPANITCVGNSTCGSNMGNTYGTPIIRRLHDGRWGVIFGNGFGSSNGDAGIFVMTIDSSGNKLFYYLSTGNNGGGAKNNGIAYVSSADLDGDHVTDYVYAGDNNGNLWRFDLTSATETGWKVSAGPLFKTPAGQPITTAVTVSSGATTAGGNTIMIAFGTGNRNQFTNAGPVQFQPATQSLYGVWDWNMTAWNAQSTVQFAALTTAASNLTAPNFTLTPSKLQQADVHPEFGWRDARYPVPDDDLLGRFARLHRRQWPVRLVPEADRRPGADRVQPAAAAGRVHGELDRARQQYGPVLYQQHGCRLHLRDLGADRYRAGELLRLVSRHGGGRRADQRGRHIIPRDFLHRIVVAGVADRHQPAAPHPGQSWYQ